MLSQNSKLMADLMKKPGHTDPLQGKNQDHVEKIIPERVFLFLSLLFEGMDILVGLIENLLEPRSAFVWPAICDCGISKQADWKTWCSCLMQKVTLIE